MKTRLAFLAAGILVAAQPAPAFTLVERGSSFDHNVTFNQVAMCDGSVRLEKGTYRVHVQDAGMGDGSVRASFFDKTGRKAGEAHGIIAVLRSAGESKIMAGGAANASPSGPSQRPTTFSALGLHANSPAAFRTEGSQLKLVIGGEGQNQILIGLLLPAVQVPAVQLPAVQKHLP